jgi:asparagine synthase (glutamine-hydrolysing)
MCGIGGIVTSERSELSLRHPLMQLQITMQHRGPDDAGFYLAPDGRTGFVHTRLAILDLSAAGHQPMFSADRRYVITFNGEIYNFKDLRDCLISNGEVFQTQTDTEVILNCIRGVARHVSRAWKACMLLPFGIPRT